jgi:hypothetical protein
MDSASKKKLIVPCLVFVVLLALNTNSIINGINQHQTSRVVIAATSSAVIVIAFFLLLRSVKRNSNKPS